MAIYHMQAKVCLLYTSAAAISSDGEIIIEPFKFTNDADGFQLLVSKLESFDKNSLCLLYTSRCV